eukprot:6962001-Prymnesium_polylepis.1
MCIWPTHLRVRQDLPVGGLDDMHEAAAADGDIDGVSERVERVVVVAARNRLDKGPEARPVHVEALKLSVAEQHAEAELGQLARRNLVDVEAPLAHTRREVSR